LMDAEGDPPKNVVIHPSDTDYLIAFYGYPTVQPKKKITSEKSVVNSGDVFGRGLIINNYKMEQVHYFYKLGYNDFVWVGGKKVRKNVYASEKYDMDYFPFARSFQKLLKSNWTDRFETKTEGTDSPE